MQHVVIIGGGFAGVWSALGASAMRQELGRAASDLRITLVSRDPYLTIRPRLYEADPEGLRVPFDMVLDDIGVEHLVGEVTRIAPAARALTVHPSRGLLPLAYDRLILAAGSVLNRPAIRGAAEHAFSVDNYAEAMSLHRHLATLPARPAFPGRFTAVVIGAGFTGLEVATGMIGRLRALAARAGAEDEAAVLLVERAEVVGPDLGANPRPVIETALRELGVGVRLGRTVTAVDADGVTLTDGERIPAATTVWTSGLRASDLAAQLPVERDALGRLPVDEYLRVRGVAGVLAAGDVARAMADAEHVALMSCQHAIPMGECAGRNAVAEVLGGAPAVYTQPHYVTCLDLGAWGALFTEGWERSVRLTGLWAKVMKETINTRLIYPPTAGGGPNRARTPDAKSLSAA
jgi:NADH:ubiquinone reductase (H+-translocating)